MEDWTKQDDDTLMYVLDMCVSLSADKIQVIINNLEIMIENKRDEEDTEKEDSEVYDEVLDELRLN